ncbi:MAG: protein kinase, partial [Bacteroidota bacterium]
MTPPTDPQRWPEIKRLFESALVQPPASRGPFLDQACRTPEGAPDHALRNAVETLLAADSGAALEPAGGFLAEAPLAGLLDGLGVEAAPAEPELSAGARVGPYRVLRLLGRGGMGEVYLAERADGVFERTVALKRVRADLSPAVASRFEAERQILAGLVHPGIARLYGAGFEDGGRPWLAMEPVDGVPITTYARDRDRRQRVELLRQACAAVHHAHQRQVVHRDLKPSNVLVTEHGRVVLLDFGIAQVMGAEEERRLLTRAYAAPEQLRGEATTTASDVYGLGALLVETLTGERPDGPGDTRTLGGDLADVAGRALAPEAASRYPSAEALTADLGRWLDGRPVAAHAPTLAYRARRFVGRNRIPVAVGLSALALVAVALVAATLRVTEERDLAQQAAVEAEVVAETQGRLLRVLEPAFRAETDTAGAAAPTVDAVVEDAAQAIEEAYADNPAALGRSYATLGETLWARGQRERADAYFVRALALRQPLARPGDPVVHTALVGRGLIARARADSVEAQQFFRQALAMEREHPSLANEGSSTELFLTSVLGDLAARERELLRLVAERRAEDPDAIKTAQAHNELGVHYFQAGDYRRAYREYLVAERIARELWGELHPATNTMRVNLAYAAQNLGDHDASVRHAQVALDASRRAGIGPIREASL